jgi:hypothetical protein
LGDAEDARTVRSHVFRRPAAGWDAGGVSTPVFAGKGSAGVTVSSRMITTVSALAQPQRFFSERCPAGPKSGVSSKPLAGLRWPDGFVCSGCGGRAAWRLKTRPRVYECSTSIGRNW